MIELHPDEKKITEVRRFWLPIATQGFAFVLAALIPFALFTFIPGGSETHFMLLLLLWALVLWVLFSIFWTNHYLDVLIITTKRVVDIEQVGLFNHDLAEMRIENIEDMRVEVVGILASVLDFGTLHVQTAAESKEFVVRNIRHPHRIKDVIARQHDSLKTQAKS